MKTIRCQICGRTLEADESINRGVGSKCAERYANGIQAAGWAAAAVEALETLAIAESVERVRRAKLAIGRGRISEAKFWLERAAEFAANRPAQAIARTSCDHYHGDGVVSEPQDSGAPGAGFRAVVDCECVIAAPMAQTDDFCDGCFSSACIHVLK
jgi:hypothetical protein